MQALVLSDIGTLELRQLETPKIAENDILIKVGAVGVCGTDFHIFDGLTNFNRNHKGEIITLSQQPQILGHEIMGIVEEVGKNVHDLQKGDRIVVDQGLNCFSRNRSQLCEYCLTDDSHQCDFYQELGLTGIAGGFTEYMAIPAVNAIKINSPIPNKVAVLTEPLSCIVHCLDVLNRSKTRFKFNTLETHRQISGILIYGAGPAGLMLIQYLRNVLQYDGLLLVSEPNEKKRELAEIFGAEAINPETTNIIDLIAEKTHGKKLELVIDACGAGAVFDSIHNIIRKQATILLYGYGHGGMDLSVLNSLQFMETILIFATGGSGGFAEDKRPLTYSHALQLLENQQIQVSNWLTHIYTSLDSLPQAFLVDYKKPQYIKGIASF